MRLPNSDDGHTRTQRLRNAEQDTFTYSIQLLHGFASHHRTVVPLTLALSHQGRGDYNLPLGRIPSPLVGEG